jgi:uncharacterized protein (DUF1330 family)
VAAFLIVDVSFRDPEGAAEYRQRVPACVARHGGRFVVRGGAPTTLEGEWTPSWVTIVEFPSRADLMRWYESDDYRPLRNIRQRCASSRIVVVDALPS